MKKLKHKIVAIASLIGIVAVVAIPNMALAVPDGEELIGCTAPVGQPCVDVQNACQGAGGYCEPAGCWCKYPQ